MMKVSSIFLIVKFSICLFLESVHLKQMKVIIVIKYDSIIKLHGINYSQHWSQGGLWTSQNPNFRKDLESLKKLGFNTIRSGGAPLSNEALDLCDELGLLVFQEFPAHTNQLVPLFAKGECSDAIEKTLQGVDFRHGSYTDNAILGTLIHHILIESKTEK
jgi:hypothetical protein